MREHRFAEQMTEAFAAQQVPVAPVGGFIVLPVLGMGVDCGMLWLYQQAFQAAQNEVQAVRRAQWLTASLN